MSPQQNLRNWSGIAFLMFMALVCLGTCHQDQEGPRYATATYDSIDGGKVHCAGIYGDMHCHDDSQGQP